SGFKHIVYATRFEERDYRIPPYLEALAQRCEARLSVVFVSRKLPEDRFPSRNPILEQVYRMETEPSNVFFYNLYHRDVVAGINLFITSYPTDLLALLPRRRPAYAMRLGSSLTRSLAGKVKIPLLAVMD
ncbi:MAG: hypothetical protein EAZ89_13875, partial [Bacteroidetes bacterium]